MSYFFTILEKINLNKKINILGSMGAKLTQGLKTRFQLITIYW